MPAHEADGEARRRLDVEFASIAVPALAQFAAEPLAGLVDTAYLGRLGATALGGAGIAIGAHFATAKLFNDPLLRTSISIVASGDGAARLGGEDSRDAAISAAQRSSPRRRRGSTPSTRVRRRQSRGMANVLCQHGQSPSQRR